MPLSGRYHRIGVDMLRSSRIQLPLAWRDLRRLVAAGADTQRRPFVKHVLWDFGRFCTGRVRPVKGETLERAIAAARWLARAHEATGGKGLSYGYFPCRDVRGWRGAYPETTGYTIPTFLDVADVTGQGEFRARAIELAMWEVQCLMPSGAIAGGEHRPNAIGVPASFNTGMVLHGLIAAYRETGEPILGESVRRAADFLVADLDPNGHFRSHGAYVSNTIIKTYSCLCAWPLYMAGTHLGDPRYIAAALRAGDAALGQQRGRGWFANNCLTPRLHAPWLHTIAYTLQGLLELSILSGEEKYRTPVLQAAESLGRWCVDGFVQSRWYADWTPAGLGSCLTGSAQLAVVYYRLAEETGNARYRDMADTIVDYLKALQLLESPDHNLVGAIGGSFPLVGSYMRLGFPQWATKYFLDALLCQERLRRRATHAETGVVGALAARES